MKNEQNIIPAEQLITPPQPEENKDSSLNQSQTQVWDENWTREDVQPGEWD